MSTHEVTKHKRYDREYPELEYDWQDWKFIATSTKYPKFRAFAYVSRKEFALQESKRHALMSVNRAYMEFLDSLDVMPEGDFKQCAFCQEYKLESSFYLHDTGYIEKNCWKCASIISGNYIKERKK